jgi:hypothetical protein
VYVGRPKPQRLERDRTTTTKRVQHSSEDRRRRTSHDLCIGLLQRDAFIVRGLPGHETFEDVEEALALALLLSPPSEIEVRVRADGIIDQTRPTSTARAAASGRRAHHRWRVAWGWPLRIDLSRADSALMVASGSATSMSFFL